MKLAFSTLGCPDWTFEKILSEARNMGFSAVEIRGIGFNVRADTIPELKKEYRAETKEMLSQSGIPICVIGCSASFSEPVSFEASLSEGRFAIEAAAELGVPFIRVFGDHIRQTDSIRRVAEGISRLCDFAVNTGVTVLLETHGDFNTSGRLLETAERIERDNFGILWDIEHTRDDAEFIDNMFPLIRHVHLKDIDRSGKLCLPGEGILDLPGTAKMLTDRGYNGLFSLEWEKRWKRDLPEPEVAFKKYIRLMNN